MTKTILLVPDTHAHPSKNNLAMIRAMRSWLQRNPRRIWAVVHIGDLWDFPSLCTHEQGSPRWFQQSLSADIRAGYDMLRMLDNIADKHQIPATRRFLTLGNHEDRYRRFMSSDNRLVTSDFPKTPEELVKISGSKFRSIPFGKPLLLEGITFQHYFASGVMGRPHGGERPALAMLRTHHVSTVQGHKHILDFSEHTRADGQKIFALVCGSFVVPDAPIFDFAYNSKHLWWNGFHLLHVYKRGQFDLESVSAERL